MTPRISIVVAVDVPPAEIQRRQAGDREQPDDMSRR